MTPIYRNVLLTVSLAAVWLVTPARIVSQTGSGTCHTANSNCKSAATTNYNNCVTGCNNNSTCINNCKSVENGANTICGNNFNNCIQSEADACEQSGHACPGDGNSGGYCNFTSANEQCICFPCQCSSSPPSCPSPVCQSYGGWLCDSPILVDALGEGFHLTSAEDGVYFDLWADGTSRKFAWTNSSYHNAWLALDRNNNGIIDNGSELFGSATAQPKPPEGKTKNGFNALAVFDKPENGGNGDGLIDSRDAVYSKLLLWIDENHDGISQPSELKHLLELGVYRI